LRDSSFGSKLFQFFRAASSIIKRDIGQAVDVRAFSLVKDETCEAGETGPVRILAPAKGVRNLAGSIAQGVSREAGGAGAG